MIEDLVVDFFQKIEENECITSKNGKSNFLIQELLEQKHGKFNYIGVQKATRLQRKYIDKNKNVSATLKDGFLKDVMAQYLNYEDYNDYLNTKDPIIINTINKEVDNDSVIIKLVYFLKKHQKIIIGIIIPSLSILFFFINKSYLLNNNFAISSDEKCKKNVVFSDDILKNLQLKIDINLPINKEISETKMTYTNEMETDWKQKKCTKCLNYYASIGHQPKTKKELKQFSKRFLYHQGLLK